MVKPYLRIVSLDGFLRQLNANTSLENPIKRSGFVDRTPRKTPASYRKLGKELVSRGRYPLEQYQEIFYAFGDDALVGHMDVEKTLKECEAGYAPDTEFMKVVFYEPLQLENGLSVPACRIEVLARADEQGDFSLIRRVDELRHFSGLWHSRADLSKAVPTEWFYGKPAEGYKDGNLPPEDPWAVIDAEVA